MSPGQEEIKQWCIWVGLINEDWWKWDKIDGYATLWGCSSEIAPIESLSCHQQDFFASKSKTLFQLEHFFIQQIFIKVPCDYLSCKIFFTKVPFDDLFDRMFFTKVHFDDLSDRIFFSKVPFDYLFDRDIFTKVPFDFIFSEW